MPRNSNKEEQIPINNKDKNERDNIYARLQYEEKGNMEKNKKKRFNYL